MNDPPDQTAVFKAENVVSEAGTTLPKYSLKYSSGSSNAESVSVKILHTSLKSPSKLWYTTSDSYCAETPSNYFCSASGIPKRSNVRLISSGTSSHERLCFSDGLT